MRALLLTLMLAALPAWADVGRDDAARIAGDQTGGRVVWV